MSPPVVRRAARQVGLRAFRAYNVDAWLLLDRATRRLVVGTLREPLTASEALEVITLRAEALDIVDWWNL